LGLGNTKTLTTLSLSSNSIGDEGCEHLGTFLAKNRTVTNLDISSNFIAVNGSMALAEGMKSNSTLSTLNLRNNSIGNKGCTSFSVMLKANTALRFLDLGNNYVVTEGCAGIAEALKENTGLRVLHLDLNGIGSSGCIALTSALRSNSTLKTLFLGKNNIRANACVELSACLQRFNKSLTNINLDANLLGEEGLNVLGDLLESNSTALKYLSVDQEDFSSVALQSFRKKLFWNTTLNALNIRFPSSQIAFDFGVELPTAMSIQSPSFTQWRECISIIGLCDPHLFPLFETVAQLSFHEDGKK
jgi:hypothetical protein